MKPLSEALLDLAGRVHKLETSTKAGFESDRAELEKTLGEIGSALDAGGTEFEAAMRDADAQGSEWWNETRQSIARQLEGARSRYESEAEDAREQAKPTGHIGDVDTRAAVALANYCLTAAEYSIADAALKGLKADEPAPQQADQSV